MAEETLYDSAAMRRFAGIEPGDDRIPDVEGTVAPVGPRKPRGAILNFRHLLERYGLTEAIFAEVNAHLSDKGITLRPGTLVDVSGHTPLVRVRPRKIPVQDHRCAVLDQEQGGGARSRDVVHQEGRRLVFRQ